MASFPFPPPVFLRGSLCISCVLCFSESLFLPDDNYLPLITISLLFLDVFPVSNKTMVVEKFQSEYRHLYTLEVPVLLMYPSPTWGQSTGSGKTLSHILASKSDGKGSSRTRDKYISCIYSATDIFLKKALVLNCLVPFIISGVAILNFSFCIYYVLGLWWWFQWEWPP